MKNKSILSTAALLCLLPVCGVLQAAPAIERVAATKAWAASYIDEDRMPVKAIDGSGLDSTGTTHDTAKETGWLSAQNAYGWFVADLGADTNIVAVKIWNYNWVNSNTSYAGRGVRQFDMLVAPSSLGYNGLSAPNFGDGNWAVALEDQIIDKASGNSSYSGIEAIAITNSAGAKRIVNGRYVALRIDAGGDKDGYCGLAEIRFDVLKDAHRVDMTGVSSVTTTSATFSGEMTSADGSAREVFLVYGEGGADSPGAGVTVVSCGTQFSGVAFSKTIDNLDPGKSYHGAFYVSNGSELPQSWSRSVSFSTGAVSVTMPDDFYEGNPLDKLIVFSRPAACADYALTAEYELGGTAADIFAASLPGSVAFAAGVSAVTNRINASSVSVDEDKTLTLSLKTDGTFPLGAASSGSVVLMDVGSATPAADVAWTGGAGDMLWAKPANWSKQFVPRMMDNVTVAAGTKEVPVSVAMKEADANVLNIGVAAGSGAVCVEQGTRMLARNTTRVGADGNGSLRVNGGEAYLRGALTVGNTAKGTVTVDGGIIDCSGKVSLGYSSTGEGELAISGGLVRFTKTDSNTKQTFGLSGRSRVEISGGELSISSSGNYPSVLFADNAGSYSELVMTGGDFVKSGYTITFGNNGEADFTMSGGHFKADRGATFGAGSTGVGRLSMTGGTFETGRSSLHIGTSGKGYVKVSGTAKFTPGRGIKLGENATGEGHLEVEGVSVYHLNDSNAGEGYTVGGNGLGELYLHGEGAAIGSKRGGMTVGTNGCVHGSGRINLTASGANLVNNGIVRSEGSGSETAVLKLENGGVSNTIANETTNGWYAVGNSKIVLTGKTLKALDADATTGERPDVVTCWGETWNADPITLVNSVRFVFKGMSADCLFSGELLSPEMSSLSCPSRGAVGVWKFDIAHNYDSADVEFRYDHVKAPYGVQMYQWDAENETWTKLETTKLDGRRAKVTVSDASKMFAAVASGNGLILMIR